MDKLRWPPFFSFLNVVYHIPFPGIIHSHLYFRPCVAYKHGWMKRERFVSVFEIERERQGADASPVCFGLYRSIPVCSQSLLVPLVDLL